MWDTESFLAGFAVDGVVLTLIMVVLGPWLIQRWMVNNLGDVISDFIHSEQFAKIRADLIQQFKGGVFGGRPLSVKGMVKQVAGEAIMSGIRKFIFRGVPGTEGAPIEPPP